MWISSILTRKSSPLRAEKGSITIAGAAAVETGATVNERNAVTYAPYGYTCAAPVGEEVLLVPCAEGQAAVGTRCRASALETGEIEIASAGGASIRLANDGGIYLNGRLFMDRTGVVYNGISTD